MALKESDCKDVFRPAKLQFGGSGSYGNGGAMRISPIALFGNSQGEEYIVNAAKECAQITHAHKNGYNGAVLQCLAVNAALKLDPSEELDPVHFIDGLLEKMEKVEKKWLLCSSCFNEKKSYCESLKIIKDMYIEKQEDISPMEIARYLGHGIAALRSVPTAIYSFLRGMKPLEDYEQSNPFVRTLYFAISVGGDTDTIASMAGSIAGAYYGIELIPDILQKRCESIDKITELANKLFIATQQKE